MKAISPEPPWKQPGPVAAPVPASLPRSSDLEEYDVAASYNPSSVYAVILVGMRKRKAALDSGDTVGQARAEASLDRLKPTWLSTDWATWQAAGYPVIG